MGKGVIEEGPEVLPEYFRRDGLYYGTDDTPRDLREHARPTVFRPAFCQDTKKLSYEVRNAVALGRSLRGNLLAMAFLLDAFGGRQVQSLLIRVALSMAKGQSVVIVTTMIGGADPRDPRESLRTFIGRGFDIQFLDVTRLPYSLYIDDFPAVHSLHTLVV